jgi:DNA-binding NarL/FixJ family response regulator
LPRGAFPENQPGGLTRMAYHGGHIPLITGKISEFQRRSLMGGACFSSSSEVYPVQLHARDAPCMKILVVDDHVLIREAMRGVLRELKGEAAVILEAPDSRQAILQIEQNPDVELVLLDLGLPDRDGLEMLSDLANRYPTISVVVLSAQQDRDTVMKALDLGALGFIPKSGQREVMLSAFNLIFSGGLYIPPEILNRREPAAVTRAAPASVKTGASAADLGLTERQLEVLALMMQGKSNKAISRVLDLAEPTVKIYVSAILKALKVANRTEAVIAATALGLGVRQYAR